MNNVLWEYLPIIIFLGIAIVMACIVVIIPYIIAIKNPDEEKLSQYECGFEPLGDARSRFDIRFYLVSLLFIIFDLEIAFLFPWSIVLGDFAERSEMLFCFWSMMVFLAVLTVGFAYEWKKGALEWE
jgi:NADH-quinone oxidoreductase subunit A